MNTTYSGGSRSGDLVLWALEVNDFMRSERTVDGQLFAFRERDPEWTLTLQAITQAECEAVIALVNSMRSSARSMPEPEPVRLGNRFSGLDI
jgi:hypothetical protein